MLYPLSYEGGISERISADGSAPKSNFSRRSLRSWFFASPFASM